MGMLIKVVVLVLGIFAGVKICSPYEATMSTPDPGPTTMEEKKRRQQRTDSERREICKYILEYEQRCGGRSKWWVIKDWFEQKYPGKVLCRVL